MGVNVHQYHMLASPQQLAEFNARNPPAIDCNEQVSSSRNNVVKLPMSRRSGKIFEARAADGTTRFARARLILGCWVRRELRTVGAAAAQIPMVDLSRICSCFVV